MRLGKWIKVFGGIVPIPAVFSSSFGLRNGSKLYLAPITATDEGRRDSAEIIISPIPISSWRSACQLSVRLQDRSGALADATAFLKERGISILLTEVAATFQERAHWDAICDLKYCPEFSSMHDVAFSSFAAKMRAFLRRLTKELKEWTKGKGAFLKNDDYHAEFRPLTGLNTVSFKCENESLYDVPFVSGGITLPLELMQENIYTVTSGYANCALVTGNTEQRYMRLFFIPNEQRFVKAEIEFDISKVPPDGIGMLHQVLRRLPPQLNLLHITFHRVHKENGDEQGLMRMIGEWHKPDEKKLAEVIAKAEIKDLDGNSYHGVSRLKSFKTPDEVNPRVFISYSKDSDAPRLNELKTALSNANFEPVVGTDLDDYDSGRGRSRTVSDGSFDPIATCVAFISLHTKRNDLRIGKKYITSPWVLAEEVFAIAKRVFYVARIVETGVECRVNQDGQYYKFTDDREFTEIVRELVGYLSLQRRTAVFKREIERARGKRYKIRPEFDD